MPVNITNSSIKVFTANATSAIFVFIGTTFFARKLGPEPIGIFFLFQALMGFLSIISDFGLRGAIEKRLSEGSSQSRILGTGLVLKSVPLAGICTVLWFVRDLVNSYLGYQLTIFLLSALIVRELAELTIFILRGELRVGETAVLRFTYQAIWLFTSVLLYELGYNGVKSLVYGVIAGFAVIAFWGAIKQNTGVRAPNIEQARSLVEFSKYNVAAHIGGYFYSWIDVLVIGFFLTQSAVGAYEVAWRVTLLVTLFSNALARSVFPVISKWEAAGELEQVGDVLPVLLTTSLLLVIPAVFGALIIAKPLLRELFGAEYVVASLVLILLSIEKAFQAIRVVIGKILKAIDQPRLEARATIIAVAVNFGLNIVLVPTLGIEGAALATLVSFGLHTLLDGYYLSTFVDMTFQRDILLWCCLSATAMSGIVYGITTQIRIQSLIELLIVIGSGGLVYSIFILAYRPLRQQLLNLRTLL